MSNPLVIGDAVTVHVRPPGAPRWRTSAPAAAPHVHVVPVVGPPGPPGADGDLAGATQLTIAGVAETALSGHRVVTRPPSGLLSYADNRNLDHLHAPLLLAVSAAEQGAALTVVALGPVRESSWSWQPGPIYLGRDGHLTQTAPTAPGAAFLVQVAVAESPVDIFFDREPSIRLV